MPNITEHSPSSRSRPGSWQFPTSSEMPDDDADSEHEAHAAPSRRGAGHADEQRGAAGQRGNQLATALGWLSIGVGVAHLLAPRAVAKAAGLPPSPLMMRAMGVRELVCGVGLLNQPDSPTWRWSRVAGDAADLLMLGVATRAPGSARGRLAATAAVVAGVAALDVMAGVRSAARQPYRATALAGGAGMPVTQTVSINRSPDECYQFWRDLERLPRFMQHLESVQRIDERRSHWKAKGPAGSSVEWDADITEDVPGQRLAWRSVDGADVANEGVVEFLPGPGGRGTVLTVGMRYDPPAGKVGAVAAKLFGEEPSQQIEEDLRRFKQLIETGEIATTNGQPSGRRSFLARLFNKEVRP
ncbi:MULTISPECIES: SRPBCC family protein [unclassified Janthinobacterium]|uniref:SRPBCC family protein n=1 Tax=unclassified Janthinobacterium TaxID=2610881 RepID=UPI0012F9C221|nr:MULTISPECIES: SRPBCC family protein [unclassified Janthinobacterium]MEC5159019.1 putative membrane protein [Janthinobacterium sp. CG_S6]